MFPTVRTRNNHVFPLRLINLLSSQTTPPRHSSFIFVFGNRLSTIDRLSLSRILIPKPALRHQHLRLLTLATTERDADASTLTKSIICPCCNSHHWLPPIEIVVKFPLRASASPTTRRLSFFTILEPRPPKVNRRDGRRDQRPDGRVPPHRDRGQAPADSKARLTATP